MKCRQKLSLVSPPAWSPHLWPSLACHKYVNQSPSITEIPDYQEFVSRSEQGSGQTPGEGHSIQGRCHSDEPGKVRLNCQVLRRVRPSPTATLGPTSEESKWHSSQPKMLSTAQGDRISASSFNSSDVANFQGGRPGLEPSILATGPSLHFLHFKMKKSHTFVTKVVTKTKSDKVLKATWHSV